MLDIWETIRGTRLADTLTRELPKLTVKKKQRIAPVDDYSGVLQLGSALDKDKRIITSIPVDGHTYVVLEGEKKI